MAEILFGTASFAYEGWKGLVYHDRYRAATFKVAIWFENWGKIGDWYLHPFGRYGQPSWMIEFYNFWLHARAQGHKVPLGE